MFVVVVVLLLFQWLFVVFSFLILSQHLEPVLQMLRGLRHGLGLAAQAERMHEVARASMADVVNLLAHSDGMAVIPAHIDVITLCVYIHHRNYKS